MSAAQEFFEALPQKVQPDAIRGMNCVYLFCITEAGNWTITVADNAVAVRAEKTADPSITLTISEDDFTALIKGELSGQAAFLTGKLKVEGDISLAMKLPSLFNLS
jgi:putative sterol carrier protein